MKASGVASRSARTYGELVPDQEQVGRLHEALFGWFDRDGRSFAFRGTRDPYAILISEVILQQTQVRRGGPAAPPGRAPPPPPPPPPPWAPGTGGGGAGGGGPWRRRPAAGTPASHY